MPQLISIVLDSYSVEQPNTEIIKRMTDQQTRFVKQFVYRFDVDWIANRRLLTIRAHNMTEKQYCEMLFLFPNAATVVVNK